MADAQTDLRSGIGAFLNDAVVLRGKLNPEQKQRLDAASVPTRAGRLVADMELSRMSLSNADFKAAADRQLAASKELQALAAALRTPKDDIAAMKEARDKIEKIIQAETKLKDDTEAKKAP